MFAAICVAEGSCAALAREFSPLVEESGPGAVVIDIEGLERIFGPPHGVAAALAGRAAEAGLHPGIAIASTPDAALCAARAFRGISIVPQGDEAKFLGGLPLRMLLPPPEIEQTLERWGLRRFRDLAALPERGIAERLGPEGLRLRKLARGEWKRPLVPLDEASVFQEECETEYPVDTLEPLLFLLARMLNGLLSDLASRGLAAIELRLLLTLESGGAHERVLRMPVPMLDARAFVKLMQLDLDAHPPGSPVIKIRLSAGPSGPRVTQHGLFIPLSPEPGKVEVLLARLTAIAGDGNVGSPELLDTHRPDAFAMRRFGEAHHTAAPLPPEATLAFRFFRPAHPAKVQIVFGRPAHVYADGARGSVVSFAGPWRASGDWWTARPWSRDEWDVALSDGALYRIYADRETGRWFVEGSYD
jgi:protein ImuB